VTSSARGRPRAAGFFKGCAVFCWGREIAIILRCRMGMTILKSSFTGALPDGLKRGRPETKNKIK
jgi:hypothetical protein